ncbi:MAG: tetratricopeptide repeat protein [Bacteriovoracaceae bacterium]
MEDTTIKDELKTYQELWNAKDYQKALDWLEKNPSVFGSETWHYNLATTYGQLGELAEARYHFEQSYQLGKRDEKMAESLKWIHKQGEADRWETLSSWTDYVYKFLIYRPQYFFSQLTLVFLALGFGLYAIKKFKKKGLGLFMILALISTSLGYIVSDNKLVVTKTAVEIYRGPSQIFDFQEVPAGVMLFLKPYGTQYKVLYPSSAEGWILKQPQYEIRQGSIWDLMSQK